MKNKLISRTRFVQIIIICLIFVVTIFSQTENKQITNSDVLSMLESGLSETTIVLAIQQSQPNFDTSPQALIQLKNKGASPKVLDTILQVQVNKKSTSEQSKIVTETEPRPDLKKSVYDFNFELTSCRTSGGDSLFCTFSVINKENANRELSIKAKTRMFDQSGNEYKSVLQTLGNNSNTSWYSSAQGELIPNIKVVGSVKFERVAASIQKVSALSIECYGARREFSVDFTNIPVNSNVSSTVSDTQGSQDLRLGISLYNSKDPERSFEPLAKAISDGETVTIPIYHYVKGPFLDVDDDIYEGFFKISKDSFIFRNSGNVVTKSGMQVPYSNFKVSLNKIISVKVDTRKEGRLIIELMVADNDGKEKKKTYGFYPITAQLLDSALNKSYNSWRVSCSDCDQKSEVLAKILKNLMSQTASPNN